MHTWGFGIRILKVDPMLQMEELLHMQSESVA